MQTHTILDKKNITKLPNANTAIQKALKNIIWTDEQVKAWKKNRKSSSIPSKK